MQAVAVAGLLLATLLTKTYAASQSSNAANAAQGILGNIDISAVQACQADPYFNSDQADAAQQACASVSGPSSSCPAACSTWLKGIPDSCKNVFASIWSAAAAAGQAQGVQSAIAVLNKVCGTDFQVTPTTTTSGQSPPAYAVSPPAEEESPPIEYRSPPVEYESPPAGLSPPYSGIITPPDYNSDFVCNGSYKWITLDPDAASQWGVDPLAPESGPQNAVAGNCSNLFLDDGTTPSGCCSQTQPDLSTWWQYELPQAMKVKGVKVVAPSDLTCCVDAKCKEQEPCYNRLLSSEIVVGNMSLPAYYDSPDYKDLIRIYANNATLAQAGVWSLLLSNSTVCNMVSTADLLTLESDTLIKGGANIGCGLGIVGTGIGFPTPVGRYVTMSLIGDPPRSLALCGIEICASPVK